MKLILTSFGFNSPIVSEKLRKYMDTENKSIVILPYADFHDDIAYLREKQGLIGFGFDEGNIMLGSPSVIAGLQTVDYIYVPGGDTFKLLEYIKRNNMAEHIQRLVEGGAVYIGVSAGAALATTDLEYVTAAEDNNFSFTDYSGLNFCNDIVIPHADQMPYSVIETSKGLCGADRKILLIKNGDVVVIGRENGFIYYR